MPDSNILLYISAELAVLLLLLCGFLLIHVGKLKKLIAELEAKLIALRQTLGKSRKETKKALKKLAAKEKVKPKAFLDYMDEEIEGTREHHNSLNPDRDIVLDIAPDTPLDRQAASLRHAFLIAEKEARYAGGEETSSWDVLQAKFQQIIQFYQSAQPEAKAEEPESEDSSASDESTDSSDKESNAKLIAKYTEEIEALQRYKDKTEGLESKWKAAKRQADVYYEQLMEMSRELSAGKEFDALMESYSSAFDELGNMLGGDGDKLTSDTKPDSGTNVGQAIIAHQKEVQRLRNASIDQQKVIAELRKKLEGADSKEEQQQTMAELSEQLEKQQRFLQEAETCTQLIEDELDRALQENEELRAKLEQGVSANPATEKDADSSDEEISQIESVVNELTNEGKDMLSTIAALEEENQGLKFQLEAAGGDDGATAGHVEILKSKLEEMQQELLNLQTQHIELEERYMELKESQE
ncbi:hypothetical protein [Oceanicoccus sp. KOV_DT_Chl]|uniref:hypothetical protein n=1 Tax=Oceanicoccus sp. KOV_DT_Chl TaxID=1904639 RepID=UPI000C79A1E5|nr:hypothetical protein [Oceanicoccus sp. KOV_DT_Chl]